MANERRASMAFLSRLPLYDDEKPFEVWMDTKPGIPRTNCHFEEHHNILIKDVRSQRDDFTLDSAGFEFVNHATKLAPSGKDLAAGATDRIVPFLVETVDLVQKHTSADKVFCFDWRYRKNDPNIQLAGAINDRVEPDRFSPIPPASVVHQDESSVGGSLVLERYLTRLELEECRKGLWRSRVINIWRPIVSVIQNAPLALCDCRTVAAHDIAATDKILDTFVGEGTYLHHNDDHEWFWLPNQTRDQPVIFTTYDSEAQGDTACSPHVSFKDPTADPTSPPRESVEVRTIVLSKKLF
ncbi:hypothetical protein BDZ45DRAFT_630231 [Acephala macrosclerotiorum]|nr:hypothetical protein BDZ45DRAFT_630231 [Acephala macrosclerotiorum]